MQLYFKSAVIFFILAVASAPVRAENWTNWRGPNYDGSTTETDLPDTLSLKTNLAWKAAVPGRGGATPIVWEDKIFISSADDATKELLAVCYGRANGKELWKTRISSGDVAPRGGRNNMASPSPVTDGQAVYFLFGTGDLARLDLNGKIVWQKSLTQEYGPFTIGWGYGSSPLLYKDKLYILLLRNKGDDKKKPLDSLLIALNPKDGSELWKRVRPSDAIAESLESYATPIPVEHDGKTELAIVGGDCMTGNDPETGNEIWRFGTLNPTRKPDRRLVVSAVAGGGNVYCAGAKHQAPLYAVKLGGSGDIFKTHQAWKAIDFPPDCCTPLFYNNALFVLDGDKKVVTKYDPKTGDKIWNGALPGNSVFRASPTGADGKIYAVRVTGEVYVLSAGNEFKILSELALDEGDDNTGCVSSIAIAHGNILVRTPKTLFCFKK
jgi:outer membrane protein assembly factor BamB